MTSKNWATSPAVVKSLLIYWHFWPIVFIALFTYFWLGTPNGEALKFIAELKQNEFQEMPVSIIIGLAIELMHFLCPIFAWKMLMHILADLDHGFWNKLIRHSGKR